MTESIFAFPNQSQTTQMSITLRSNTDFNSFQKLTNISLNDKNYIPWTKTARMTLKGKGLLAYINESRIRPSEWDIWNS
jgi:hypothetical protein